MLHIMSKSRPLVWSMLVVTLFGATATVTAGDQRSLRRVEAESPRHPASVNSFVEDFESGDLSSWPAWTQQLARPDSGVFVDDVVRRGVHAFKFTVAAGDRRAELVVDNGDPVGSEAFYGWSFAVPPDYQDSDVWQILAQWHHQPDTEEGETWETASRSPTIALQYQAWEGQTQLAVVLYGGEGKEKKLIALGTIDRGRWIDLVFHVRWSLGADGFVEAWMDDQPMTPWNGVDHKVYGPTMYNALPHIFKFGIYRGWRPARVRRFEPSAARRLRVALPIEREPIAPENSVYVDEVRIGNSYEQVRP